MFICLKRQKIRYGHLLIMVARGLWFDFNPHQYLFGDNLVWNQLYQPTNPNNHSGGDMGL